MTSLVARGSVYIETYGCQMNQLDSELVADQLASAGYTMVEDAAQASVVLINTCSVRDLAEHKVWSRLGRLVELKRGENPGLVIGVLGCMAEREADAIAKRTPLVDVVCGPAMLKRLPLLLENAVRNRRVQVAVAGHTARSKPGPRVELDDIDVLDVSRSVTRERVKNQAYVRVTRGCDKFCSYCVVPYTRGPEMHRAPERIIEEVQKLADAGVLEVTLLGQTVNHYHYQEGGRSVRFADLLAQVHDAVPQLPRLRFVTSYPRDFDDATLQVMANSPRICRYLHLPAQSGSNRMLQKMNRGYTVESYLELLARARAMLPDLCLAGDMIVGFPGESEEDHEASKALLLQAQYKNCFVFQYSPRDGTLAATRYADDVPLDVKHRRNLDLLAIQSEINLKHNEAKLGSTFPVMVESQSKIRAHKQGDVVQIGQARRQSDDVRLVGRTAGDEIVAFDGPAHLVGNLVTVRAVGATPLTLLAELCR